MQSRSRPGCPQGRCHDPTVMPFSPCAPQWEPVQYFNNKIICDLVEEKFKGIISILVSHLLLWGLGRDDVTPFPSLSQPACPQRARVLGA